MKMACIDTLVTENVGRKRDGHPHLNDYFFETTVSRKSTMAKTPLADINIMMDSSLITLLTFFIVLVASRPSLSYVSIQ